MQRARSDDRDVPAEGDAPLRQRGVHFAEEAAQYNDAYADVRSEYDEQRAHHYAYAGQVDALEESKHEGSAWLETSAPAIASVLAGAPGGEGPSKPELPKPKAKGGPITQTLPWLRIGDNGDLTKLTTTAKYKMASKLGVKPRDLRFLEMPTLTFSPPALLARDNAIVVAFESIRCIITLNCVYVVNPEDERTHSLIDELNTQLRSHRPMGMAGVPSKRAYSSVSKLSDVASKLRYGRSVFGLPFELKALEVCFDKLVSELSSAASELEREALPALDMLTKRVRIPDLEAVRRIKNKLVRLKTRIESIHEVVERFLNDDEDMHRLNLTAEELARQESEAESEERRKVAATQPPAGAHAGGGGGGGERSRPRSRRRAAASAAAPVRLSATVEEDEEEAQREAEGAGEGKGGGDGKGSEGGSEGKGGGRGGRRAHSSSGSSSSSFDSQGEAEVAEVEMLLEAYDMHLEHALGRLQTLDEYIQDTEDLVNTSLDQKRNELISCDVLLTSNIVALGLISSVASFMAMNIVPASLSEAPFAFSGVAIASTIGVYMLWAVFITWALKQNLVVF
ncbi:hypothetical protein FOA52_005998 [Chlamydomonas sp. UWO 241]|nr:hypothetical protein FOA52_005998 [Chlamydomonas sp. UWO 241]